MNNFLEVYWTDVYKTGHKLMLPKGSVLMQSNLTPRSGKWSNCPNEGKIVSIGQRLVVTRMQEDWGTNFFRKPVEEIDQFGEDMTFMLGLDKPYDTSHMKDLHDLGYLPLEIRSIDEGELIPYKIPLFTIVNTKPLNGKVFDWLVNYLETILSAGSWQCPTSATLALCLRKLGTKWLNKTDSESIGFLDYMFHDFSMRGMSGKDAIVNSGIGFASSFRGSDTLPVIPAARKYYGEKVPCINSVIASEHAIMCSLTGFFMKKKEGSWDKVGNFEYETFLYLIKLFPKGILSLVMDTWDIWRAVTEYCLKAKDDILARDGKLVIRPDSGDPVNIICGEDFPTFQTYIETESYFKNNVNGNIIFRIESNNSYFKVIKHSGNDFRYEEYKVKPKDKGVVELLWDVFGGTTTKEGYKKLDSHIGVIYGDSVTYERAEKILSQLEKKGFAGSNIVFGVGSYSLQVVGRDTHGFAQKATYVEIEIDGEVTGIDIFKDPITDDGVKKSAKGLITVLKGADGAYILKDQCSWEDVQSSDNQLKVIFRDGNVLTDVTLSQIRERLKAQQ